MSGTAESAIDPRYDAMRRALGQCTFLPGSSHKRFARDIQYAVTLTEAQRRHLIRLCWRYRRQIPMHLMPSKDAVAELDADWNLQREAEAALKARQKAEKAARKSGAHQQSPFPLPLFTQGTQSP
jgi:hypothetical protein